MFACDDRDPRRAVGHRVIMLASTVRGEPVEIQLLHNWRMTWIGSGAIAIALLVIRHRLQRVARAGLPP